MPRPSSSTLTEPSACSVTSMRLPWPAERLVGRVVDHLLDDVQRVVGARVHARPLLDRLEALQDADRRFAVERVGGAARGLVSMAGDSRSPVPRRSAFGVGGRRVTLPAGAAGATDEDSSPPDASSRELLRRPDRDRAQLVAAHLDRSRAAKPTDEDEPLRAELFSADQMAAHGKRLAAHPRAERRRAARPPAGAPRVERTRAGRPRQAARRRPPTPSAASRRRPNGCSTTST